MPLPVADFDFQLPVSQIAKAPAEPRDAARLLVYERSSETCDHTRFREILRYLRPGDLLVLNDTKVLPHRLIGRRSSGGRVETLLLERHGELARGYLKPAKKLEIGEAIAFEGGAVRITPLAALGGGIFQLRIEAADGDVAATLERVGRAPLPPYIERDDGDAVALDRARYQTVFAREPGAVAAPTAGLHFTSELLASLMAGGVETAHVTLHVGEGTFAPVRVTDVEQHRMHAEHYVLPEATAAAIHRARARGGRVIAVGTTAARTLETCGRAGGLVAAGEGESRLFLYPGKRFGVVDALLTNFHLPRSTLLMLVAAFAGREQILRVYRGAVEEGYRFFSFGDAMLVV